MKNHIFFTLIFLILNSSVNSQFMQNGGFEQYNDVYGFLNLNRANYWHVMFNSPDLFHEDLDPPAYGIPNTGLSCAGFGWGSESIIGSEYFFGETMELSPIAKYVLTFYVKKLDPNSATFGIKVVNSEPPTNPYQTPPYNSTLVEDYLSDSNNSPDIIYSIDNGEYKKVSYCFTPSVYGVHYVIFGQFNPQNPPANANFFLIDDVNISYATIEQQNVEANLTLTSTALCTQNTLLIDGTSSQFETEHQWEIFKLVNNQPTLVYSGNNEQGNAGVFNVTTAFSSVGYQPLPGDCYRVQLKVVNGCTDIDQLDFCYEDLNVDFLNVPAAVCEDTPTDISVTGDDNWTYTWSNGDSGEGMKTTSVIPVFPSSQYTVTVTSPSQCSQVNTITLNVHSNNNLAPWMNGIQNLSNGTLGSDPYTVYVQQGQVLSFNSQLFNDNLNEDLLNSISNYQQSQYLNISFPTNNVGIFNFYWNTGQGFAPNVSPGIYEFTLTSNDGNQCNLGEESFTYRIIVFCDQCPTCVSFENRIPSNSPLPPETKVGVCIEAGISQPVQTGNANVLFQAGVSITLGEFFEAGSGFEALIEQTTCVTDCEDCCDDWTGFTFDAIPDPPYVNFNDNNLDNDIFQITDVNHPFCAFGAQGFEFYIISDYGNTLYSLTSTSNSCCAFESPSPENPISHSSIWWDGYVTNIFGNTVRANDGVYTYYLKFFGCGGQQSPTYHGYLNVGGIDPYGIATNNDNNTEINSKEVAYESESVNGILELQQQINVVPNPTRDYIEIVGISNGQFQFVKLLDDKGLEVLSNCKFKNNKLDVSSLSPGTYFVTFTIENYEVVKKFIKL
jgi:hypothetical protein